MKLDVMASPAPTLRALRVQLIEADGGVIVKRGRAEMRVSGPGASEAVGIILIATAEAAMTRDEIARLFAAPDRPAVARLIADLETRRILVPADEDHPRPSAESALDLFHWHFDQRTADVAERLNSRPIVILGVNCVSRQLAAILAASGVSSAQVVDFPLLCNLRLFAEDGTLSPDEWPANLPRPLDYRAWSDHLNPAALGCIVATSDFGGGAALREWNAYCIRHNVHFLPVTVRDLIGHVGPLVIPRETACFACLEARQDSHLADPVGQRATEPFAFEGQAVAGFHPAMAAIVGDLAALELTRFYGGWMPPRVVGTLIEVNLVAPEVVARKVLKLPRCPVCSSLNAHAPLSPDAGLLLAGHAVDR